MLTSLKALSAGVCLLPCLLASTSVGAQEVASTHEISSMHGVVSTHEMTNKIEPPHSIISLAPEARPQGQLVARRPGDATFERTPAYFHVFQAVNAGEDGGTEVLRLNFDGSTRLTKIESKNKDFVVTQGGTCQEGNSYSKGDSCSLMVRFSPRGPGHRSGSLNISNSAEMTPMFVGLAGNGYAPVVSFTPSLMSTVPGTISGTTGTIKSATNLATDGGDILYVPDVGNNLIKMYDSSGLHTLSPVFATPQSLVADSSGFMYSTNVTGSTYYFSYYAPWGSQSAYGTTHTIGTCIPSSPCALTSVGLSRPANINIDPYDNLFMEDATKGAVEIPVSTLAGGSGTLNLWYLTNQFVYSSGNPAAFGVDGGDNLYNFYNYLTNTCFIQQEPVYSAEYSPVAKRVAGGSACGFSGDGGQARSANISSKVGQIAFDIAGNLYFTDTGNQRVRRIDAATGIISTIAGTGANSNGGDGGPATLTSLSNPSGIAVDSQGQVYILSNSPTAGPQQVIRKIGTMGYGPYGSAQKGTTSAVKVFTVANTGNSALTLSSDVAMIGSNPTDFKIDPGTTNCVLTAAATLAAGHSCNIGVTFTPGAVGTRSAYLTMLDNSLSGANKIYLLGVGVLPSPTMSITSPTTSAKTGATVTFAVSVTSSTSTKPTGSVTFKVNGSNVGNPVTLSTSGTASTTFTESSASTYTLSAVYSGDANYQTTTVTKSLSVTAAVKAPAKVSLSQSVAAKSSCNSPDFLVQVSSAAGDKPTGTVQLLSGSNVVATGLLNNGAVTLSPGKVLSGSNTLVASYGGDSKYAAGTSAPFTLRIAPVVAGSCGITRAPLKGISF